MTETLTLSDCMKYPNAKINYYSSQTGNIVAQFENIFDFIALRKFDAENDISNCRLILRDLTQLTDEEKKKCHDIGFWEYENTPFAERVILIDEKMERWKCGLSKSERDLADYLKEINVDIYGFLKSGKAVRE